MRIFKIFLDLDKEEQWLNRLARNGCLLNSVTFGYNFQDAKLDNAIYRIDCRNFKKKNDYINYITLFEDSGWKHVVGSLNSGTQYFLKVNGAQDDDIFSDTTSKAGRYKRLSNLWLLFTLIYSPFLIQLNNINLDRFLDPKLSYFTPGLWESTGFSFLFSFLFETPFAIIRSYGFLFQPMMILLFLSFSLKFRLLYKKEQNRDQK